MPLEVVFGVDFRRFSRKIERGDDFGAILGPIFAGSIFSSNFHRFFIDLFVDFSWILHWFFIDVLICCDYSGSILGVFWKYSGNILGLFWEYSGSILGIR